MAFFGLFSEDKGGYIDVWVIKITIRTNQIDMDVCLEIRQSPAFSIGLLVREFNNPRQTWYQKCIGTYPPLFLQRTVSLCLARDRVNGELF